VKEYADADAMQLERRVFARKNCSNGVTRTARLRFALDLVFLLGWAFARCCFSRDENGGAACGVASFAGRKDRLAALVLGCARFRFFWREEDGLAAYEQRCVLVVGVCVAPEGQLGRCALAVVGHVDGATTRAQEWAWLVVFVEGCGAAALVRLLGGGFEMRFLQRELEVFGGKWLGRAARRVVGCGGRA